MMPIVEIALQNQTILIVDDTPANLRVLVDYLEEIGFNVLTAQDGDEALKRAQYMRPDLILLDVMMPGMDGFETCRRMKAIDDIADIPVIFMTALTNTKSKIQGFDVGGVDYITKPFQIEEVFARIHTQLRVRAIQQKLSAQNTVLQEIITQRERLSGAMRVASLVHQNSGEGMLLSDTAYRTLAINPAFTKITGYSFDDIEGKASGLLNKVFREGPQYARMLESLKIGGSWAGELWAERKSGETYAKWMVVNTLKNETGTLQGYVTLFSDITDKKKSEEVIWRQANFDELTGLPNRHMFNAYLQREIKNHDRAVHSMALLFIDLDNFKEINDTLGHAAGDLLLKETGCRLSALTRSSDIVARLGGDEFVMILTQIGKINPIEQISQEIIDQLTQPYMLGVDIAYISASIGISFYSEDIKDATQLLNNADQAMYIAKKNGGSCFNYFTPALQEAALQRRSLIKELRSAIQTNQFVLHFQPIVEMVSGRIHKAEALVRWNHPERGILGPVEFIPVTEETGLIIELGEWIFKEAVRWTKCWTERRSGEFQVSINISPLQLKKEDHQKGNEWLAHLDEIGLSGTRVVLEITEGLLMGENAKIADKLRRYRAAGIQMAVDDFGTGYSSLSYLKKLDIDYLKIDKSFVSNLATDTNDRAISTAIIVMAHKVGLKVIAEGVETVEQRDFLIAAGCDYCQGYLYSRPVPPEQFERLLDQDVVNV
ncbi:two-component system response regulator [Glaciimonas immobilis]|uniref:Diguanylate cyclase (GGDEF)-like protein/PAS domain S-box-containing protein n=1 Tax=Glaciimonas immobilis TaxID=728004 RepID=A0A840RRV1_9BURK|nr:EAL domain-containing protein [Glaciimonas immobilis]KAF3997992.1 EAL domain-containing protein [Glaciimonas immobilis]MBB5199331.1 diguanylate cyclase (GGDEF)-like protein/PAS domain S-box-containing protein [Glaciimonas immobilis]